MYSGSRICGWGQALPRRKLASGLLESQHGLPAGSLVASTGVETRYIANRREDETQVALGLRAGQAALASASLPASSVDLIIAAAAVPQQLIPGTAALFHRGLGLPDGSCRTMDVNTTCLSALSALELADSYIRTGRASRVLIISSEIASAALPWKTAPKVAALFGDGAGAWLIEGADQPGILGSSFASFPSAFEACQIPVGGTANTPHDDIDFFMQHAFFEMDGEALYRLVRSEFEGFLFAFLEQIDWSLDDVDFFVPHQASPVSLVHMARAFRVRREQYIDLTRSHGNQIAASLPIAFAEARTRGQISDGSRVLLLGTSAGVQFGAAALIA